MITTDDNDIDNIWAPFKTENIPPRAVRELAAELPCSCRPTEKPCISCFARLMIYTGA